MKAKKLLCLLLTVVLVLALAVPAAAADETAEEEIPEYVVRMMNAADAYKPDTKVLTVNGQTIPWNVYYYLLTSELQTYIYYMGGLPENFDDVITGEVTTTQYLKESALSYVKYYTVVYAKAAEYGIELTEEDEAELNEAWDALVVQYGGEETLQTLLEESCMSKEVYMYLLRSNTLMKKLLAELYGENGEKLTDEEVLAWANGIGYVRTKHILYQYTAAETAEDATEEEKAAAEEQARADVRAKAENTLAALSELEGEDLLTKFDELMTAESEDPGSTTYPDGYIFTSGTMVTEFEDAAFALEENTISDIVETSYGCHIILRLPLEADLVTQDSDSNTGAKMTLRESAFNSIYNEAFVQWIKEGEAEWEPGFEELDLNELFRDASSGKTAVNKDTRTLIIVLAVIAAVVIAAFVLLRKKQEKTVEKGAEFSAAAAEEAAETVCEAVGELTEETAEEVAETAETAEEITEAQAEEKIEELSAGTEENAESAGE